MITVLLRKEMTGMHALRENHHGRVQKEGGHPQARRAASGKTKPASTLILDFQPIEL